MMAFIKVANNGAFFINEYNKLEEIKTNHYRASISKSLYRVVSSFFEYCLFIQVVVVVVVTTVTMQL